jgi:hypothetical protein
LKVKEIDSKRIKISWETTEDDVSEVFKFGQSKSSSN